MKLLASVLIFSAQANDARHECEPCVNAECGENQIEIGHNEIIRPHCETCVEHICEDCERCPGKRSADCGELEVPFVAGNFLSNCGKKCKDWQCRPCETCDDEVPECDEGFQAEISGVKTCECGQVADVYSCECIPCESTGPTKEECGENQYHVKDAFFGPCDDKCFDRSCVDCMECPAYEVAQCEEGYFAKDKKIYTSDCDNECLESVCAKCKPCADGKTCPAGEIAESRACDESLGDECNECGCDVWECRDCVPCEDDHSHAACEDYETMVVESTFNGECGDECSVFTCECTDPCVQMPEPNCAIDEVQKSRKETDDCGNECRVYWCQPLNPAATVEDYKNDVAYLLDDVFGGGNWANRMENAFNSIAKKAVDDFGRKNEVCDIYVEPTEGSGADEEEEDNVRGLPSGCQEDASAVRRIARKMTEWSASYNIPCGDRAGEEPVYHNKLAQKIKKWRQKLIRRACKEFKDQE